MPSSADLIDRLTIDQIKETLRPDLRLAVSVEMDRLCHDLDLIIQERGIALNARLIRTIVAVAQMNLHIWTIKDQMEEHPEQYNDLLKLAHQLNGLRNQMKNLLLEEFLEREPAAAMTNCSTDGLQGWHVSVR